jgi:hypothetical protein
MSVFCNSEKKLNFFQFFLFLLLTFMLFYVIVCLGENIHSPGDCFFHFLLLLGLYRACACGPFYNPTKKVYPGHTTKPEIQLLH